ncbi:P protein [Almendravirus chico]|uniref:P protein n=1 Tax=Almendravirus chico TaxID=1972687 RepID=UPI001E281B28|nr:P protein [Almendravirus chico]
MSHKLNPEALVGSKKPASEKIRALEKLTKDMSLLEFNEDLDSIDTNPSYVENMTEKCIPTAPKEDEMNKVRFADKDYEYNPPKYSELETNVRANTLIEVNAVLQDYNLYIKDNCYNLEVYKINKPEIVEKKDNKIEVQKPNQGSTEWVYKKKTRGEVIITRSDLVHQIKMTYPNASPYEVENMLCNTYNSRESILEYLSSTKDYKGLKRRVFL